MQFGEQCQVRGDLGIEMLGGLRHEIIRGSVGRIRFVELRRMRVARRVRPDEVVGFMQRYVVLRVGHGLRIDAGQMVAVEDDGDRAVDCIEFLEKI